MIKDHRKLVKKVTGRTNVPRKLYEEVLSNHIFKNTSAGLWLQFDKPRPLEEGKVKRKYEVYFDLATGARGNLLNDKGDIVEIEDQPEEVRTLFNQKIEAEDLKNIKEDGEFIIKIERDDFTIGIEFDVMCLEQSPELDLGGIIIGGGPHDYCRELRYPFTFMEFYMFLSEVNSEVWYDIKECEEE